MNNTNVIISIKLFKKKDHNRISSSTKQTSIEHTMIYLKTKLNIPTHI